MKYSFKGQVFRIQWQDIHCCVFISVWSPANKNPCVFITLEWAVYIKRCRSSSTESTILFHSRSEQMNQILFLDRAICVFSFLHWPLFFSYTLGTQEQFQFCNLITRNNWIQHTGLLKEVYRGCHAWFNLKSALSQICDLWFWATKAKIELHFHKLHCN